MFQAGSAEYCIGAGADPKERYLLSRAGWICWQDEHLYRYIRDYMNAWHEHEGGTPNVLDFDRLHGMLEREIGQAKANGDASELARLLQLADLMRVIEAMD